MASLATILKDVLLQEDRVTIPGFGTFETTYQSAQLDIKSGVIHPPTKTVTLDVQKTSGNDDKLMAALGKVGITESEAGPMIKEFVDTINTKLAQNGNVVIDEVGVIYKADNNRPALRPVASKLSIDNYGLDTEEIEPVEQSERIVAAAAPITKNGGKSVDKPSDTKTTTKVTSTKTVTTTTKKTEEKKSGGLLKALLIILPIVALLAILFVVFKDKIMGTPADGGNTTVAANNNKPKADETPVVDLQPTKPADTKKEEAKPASNIDPDLEILAGAGFANVSPQDLGSKYKKYYLVGGSFRDKQKANQEKRRLGAADILHVDGTDLYRVVFIGSNSAKEVVEEYNKVIGRGINPANVWLLKNSKN